VIILTEFFLGKRARHGYAVEAAYGTANPATTYSWMGIIQSISPTSKSELFQINAMDDTDSRNVSEYIETLRTYTGSVEFLVQHCRPLLLGYGTDTLTGSDPYVHTFIEGNELKSFTFNFGYQHTTDHAIDYTGCVVNRMDIGCSKGEFMKCTFDFVAQKGVDHAFRSYQTGDACKEYPTVGAGAIRPFMYSDAEVEINGVSYSPETIRMTINNNLLSEPVLNTTNTQRIAEPIPQLREYEASMTLKMATDDLYDLWETGTYAGTDPTITFTRTAVNDFVEFTLEDAVLESAISPYNINDGIVIVELPFKVKKIGIVETNAINVDYDTVET
jgi:hypothetical protein